MIGIFKKVLITGLTVILLCIPFSQNAHVLAKEHSKGEHKGKQKNELTTKQAINLAIELNKISNYVQRGGEYKKNEYKTFSHNDKTYRYLSSSIDTKKELKRYLEKVLVPSEAEQFMNSRGIIEYRGKLAQVEEADGGSLLQWERASAQYVKTEKNTFYYRLTVPVWSTSENQDFIVEYQYFNKDGWKISKEPKQENITAISNKLAVELAAKFEAASSYVQAGGEYGRGEYKTFFYNGYTYRYLSSKIDTKTKLLNYLTQSMTQAAAEQFIKDRGIIEYNGKLAQIEADGGSLAQWSKATAEFMKTDMNTTFYRVTVPIGNTKENQTYIVEYQYVDRVGWRVSKEPQLEKSTAITDKIAVELAAKFQAASSYVEAGGEYGPGEYKTFFYNGYTYRYLASKIDTKTKLLNYLTQSMTQAAAEQFIKDRGIIEYNGKLAQIEADGGSMAQWSKATAEFIKTDNNTTFYRVTVPIGNTNEKQMYIVEYQYVEKAGWRVSKEPYWNLDIPSNINPISTLFNYLLIDSKVAQNQFLPYSSFQVTEFKKGIKKVELTKLKEIGKSNSQVEFIAYFNVELENNYRGLLKNGENKMYFTVQSTGSMEFKIDRVGIVNMY